jgi:site-specific DNA-methyltransferase (adenine-specific)
MTYKILHGNNLDILPTLPDNSVDSIVTDPPYELGFMGKKWDSSGIAYSVELWQQCLRVLKPGGHLLSFGGTRTYHRVAVAIEDAGFDLRDSIAWLYGSGFPKSMDVAKAIDKQSGYQGKVVGSEIVDVGMQGGSMHAGRGTKLAEREIKQLSPEAQQWQGWGTALKPAFEPVIVARKPIEGTVANNVLKWGTGGLNIDASRIGTEQRINPPTSANANRVAMGEYWDPEAQPTTVQGRWPANLILDEYTAELLDEQSGQSASKSGGRSTGRNFGQEFEDASQKDRERTGHTDSGGASRFFYVAKASKRDRNEGLDDMPLRKSDQRSDKAAGIWAEMEAPKQNFHPTVKPTALMQYLVKLVTPPGGTVLDPFTGSGSTGKAAILEGFDFIGIELTEDYWPIIEGRLKHAEAKVAEAKENQEAQPQGLF